MNALGLILSLLIPLLAGWPWVRRLPLGSLRDLQWLLAWGFGASALMLGQFLIGLAGVAVTQASGCFILGAFWLAGRHGLAKPTAAQLPQISAKWHWLLILPLILLVGQVALSFWQVSQAPLWGMAGEGVWGLKARVIADTAALPWEIWREDARPYLHREYPPGFPLQLAWCLSWSGGYEADMIKWLGPVGMLAVLTALIQAMSRGADWRARFIALSVVAALASLDVFQIIATQLYAEGMILLLGLGGLLLLTAARRDGEFRLLAASFVLLGAAAFVKQEGVLLLLLAAMGGFIRPGLLSRRVVLLSAASAMALGILLWILVKHHFGMEMRDFAPPAHLEKLPEIWNYIISHSSLAHFGGLALLLFFALVLDSRPWRLRFLALSSILLIMMAFAACYFFSTRPLEWHLTALHRLTFVIITLHLSFLLIRVPVTTKNSKNA